MYPQPADPRLTTRWTNGHQIVAVAGAIDICTAPAVRAYLQDTIGAILGNGGQGSDLVLTSAPGRSWTPAACPP
jgi:hypothetical protein